MVERSAPKWAKIGDSLTLTCKTSQAWDLCRWEMPNGQKCDRRSNEVYSVSCMENARVKFKVTFFKACFGDAMGTHWDRVGLRLHWECTRDALGMNLGRIGNALGTHWRRNVDTMGTHWECIGDALGTHWERMGTH